MNIFKILANGDGTINEANISAFLGYLLDPYQDHGLGFKFLEEFLKKYFVQQGEDFNCRKYDYEILFEQAFRDEDKTFKKKEIVDIVILCFESNKGKYKESIAKNAIQSTQDLKYIFLIENKVTEASITVKQLEAQYENTIKSLDLNENKVISLYITPYDDRYETEFNNFDKNKNKYHYIWKKDKKGNEIENESENENENQIINLLLDIIKDESNGKIEAINEYTRHTMISFIRFIENNFKSQIVEKKENAEGKFKKDIYYDINEFFSNHNDILNYTFKQIIVEFTDFIKSQYGDLTVRHTKTHPISVFLNQNSRKRKIFSFTKKGKEIECHIILRNGLKIEISDKIREYLSFKNIEYQEKNFVIYITGSFEIDVFKTLFKDIYEILNPLENEKTTI